jgi:hypothetical protein
MAIKNNLGIYPLQQQIKESEPELLDLLIGEFSCAKDHDVESFLKINAINYEKIGLSRTYLYITRSTNGSSRHIAAYFTIAIAATSFQGISKSRKAKVLGFKPGRDTKDHFGGILIGQLARADGFDSSAINGHEMIEDAEELIEQGRYYLGGKIVYLDCREPLIAFYRENGYSLVTQEPFPNGYYKMFKTLPPLVS